MTNAEAIETLRENYPDACFEQLREAVDAAIAALKAQDATGDTIIRQAAIDKFEPWLKVKGYNEGELNMLKAVLYELKFLPSAHPEQRWIPVTERLPENGVEVLAWCESGFSYVDWWLDGKWKVNSLVDGKYERITHWMPLPEPPKEG